MKSTQVKQSVYWLSFASVIGFLVPSVFSMGFALSRPLYLIPLSVIIGMFLFLYFRHYPLPIKAFFGFWIKGLIAAVAASLYLLKNIHGQPDSSVPGGVELFFTLAWVGITYGAIDGLFLNVMPALVIERAWSVNIDTSRMTRLLRGLLALFASILVTATYHLGYQEFQGPTLILVLLGNTIITSTYLVTGSPFAAVLTHIVMHLGAVLHGMETTLQLPPHYGLY